MPRGVSTVLRAYVYFCMVINVLYRVRSFVIVVFIQSWLYLFSTMGSVKDPLEQCSLLRCRTVLSWSSSSYFGPPSTSALYSSVRYVVPGGVLAPGLCN